MKKIKILMPILLSTFAMPIVSLSGCNKTPDKEIIHPTKIKISEGKATSMRANSGLQLNATVFPKEATNKEVIWQSSNPDIAFVSENGYVTAKDLGEVEITATTQDGGLTASIKITVDESFVYVSDLFFNQGKSGTFSLREELVLGTTILPSNATNPSIKYSSSNPDVAIFDEWGSVQFVGIGETILTAEAQDGSGRKATYHLTVITKDVIGYVQDGENKYYFDDFIQSGLCGEGLRRIQIGDKSWTSDNFNLPIHFINNPMIGDEPITEIPDNFLRDCKRFNSKIDLPIYGINLIGDNFLQGCFSFNNGGESLTFSSSIHEIGDNFLAGYDMPNGEKKSMIFDQDITFREATKVGINFMMYCNQMQHTLDIYLADPGVFKPGNSFVCSESDAPAFEQGFYIRGYFASQLCEKFGYIKDDENKIYRNLQVR